MKITRIEYNHATKVFVMHEFIGGEKHEYQTKDIWQVIGRIQGLVCELSEERYWIKESDK